jgi:hypothetical protein
MTNCSKWTDRRRSSYVSGQIEAIEKDPSNVVSPITHTINLLALITSDEPSKQQQMQSDLQIMKTKIANLESRPFHPILVKRDEALSPFQDR